MRLASFAIFGVIMGLLLAVPAGGEAQTGTLVEWKWQSAASVAYVYDYYFCTGLYDPPYHAVDQAIDEFADPGGNPCYSQSGSIPVSIRGWGKNAGSSYLPANIVIRAVGPGKPNRDNIFYYCSVLWADVSDQYGYGHGRERFVHATSFNNQWGFVFYTGPGWWYANERYIGFSVINESGCTATGYHVHHGVSADLQGVNCLRGLNGNLDPTTLYQVWPQANFIHYWKYYHNVAGCA